MKHQNSHSLRRTSCIIATRCEITWGAPDENPPETNIISIQAGIKNRRLFYCPECKEGAKSFKRQVNVEKHPSLKHGDDVAESMVLAGMSKRRRLALEEDGHDDLEEKVKHVVKNQFM